MAERPRLIDYLEPSLQAKALESFPADLIHDFEEGLHSVERLTASRSYLPVRPEYVDTDLIHTVGILVLRREFLDRFIHIPQEVNFEDVAWMGIEHDLGEIDKLIGDVASHGPERQTRRAKAKKRLEPKAGQAILDRIPDEEVRTRMKHLYHRFMIQHPTDKEALLTRFLDKAEATTRAYPENVFNYRALNHSQPWHQLIEHVRESTLIFTDAAVNLFSALSPQAGSEIVEFTVEELARFKPIGFKRIANTRTKEFLLATSQAAA